VFKIKHFIRNIHIFEYCDYACIKSKHGVSKHGVSKHGVSKHGVSKSSCSILKAKADQ
jgi:hypothetical protein